MKKTIHPKWYPDAQVSCACGNAFKVGSILESIRVDICAKCHPFYTGELKYIDSMGRVDRFKKKRTQALGLKIKVEEKKQRDKEREAERARAPKSLKDMLNAIK